MTQRKNPLTLYLLCVTFILSCFCFGLGFSQPCRAQPPKATTKPTTITQQPTAQTPTAKTPTQKPTARPGAQRYPRTRLTPQQQKLIRQQQQKWQREWQRQRWRQQYYQQRPRRWYDTLLSIFWWFLYSIWFWVILAVFGLPYVSVWLGKRRKLKNFTRARMAELANPIDAGARFQLGSMLLNQKRYRRALPYLEEAHNIQREQNFLDPRLLDALGDTLLALGKRDRAIELYKESLTLDDSGGQGEVYLQLGRAYQEKKEFDTAESWLIKACEANRSLAEPVFRLALHLHRQGKRDESQNLLTDFTKDAHALPTFIRKRNRKWVFLMQTFFISRFFY